MVEVRIITPPVAESDIELDLVNLTRWLVESGRAENVGGGLGGEFGYGAEFENDTFLMHPFCWCEREDCAWCGGCSGKGHHPGHGPDCYQSRLEPIQAKYGEKVAFEGGSFWSGYWGDERYNRERTSLCVAMGLDTEFGCEVHCTCGGDVEARRRYDACVCDWHMGRGVFRFGKAVQGPNFWHKPSGLQVRWYKWIGRDTEFAPAKPGPKEWHRVFAECVESTRERPVQ